jgi:hypothetical protein
MALAPVVTVPQQPAGGRTAQTSSSSVKLANMTSLYSDKLTDTHHER